MPKQKRNPNLKREKAVFKPYSEVLISHVDSVAHKNDQVVALARHYEVRGHSTKDVTVDVFENIRGRERRKTISAELRHHPEGAVFRSGLLTPCKTTGEESKPAAKPVPKKAPRKAATKKG